MSEEMEAIGARLDGLESLIKKIARSPFPIPSSEGVEQLAMALAKAQGAFTNPPKDKEVEVQPKKRDDGSWPKPYKFSYSTHGAIMDMVRKPLADNGIALMQPPVATQGGLVIRTILMHESGQWMACDLSVLLKGQNAQDQGSALTFAKRYAVCAMLSITADADDDGNSADGNAVTSMQDKPPRPTKGKKDDTPQDDFDPGMFADGFMGQVNKAKLGEISGIIDMNRSELDRLPKAFREALIEKAHARTHDLDKQEHETPIQKLGREILALVKATTNRDALNDLLIIREDDLAALKKASPDTKGADGKVVLGGYSRLMENVSKQDKFLAEDHTPISGA